MASREEGYWQRRISRRKILKGAAVGGLSLAATAVVGCAEEAKPESAGRPTAGAAPAAEQPRRGGTINRVGGTSEAQDSAGRTFDPHVEGTPLGKTMRLAYQALLGYDLVTYEVKPDLGQSWEQPSPTEYVVKMVPGVKWHNKPPANGRELLAEDVVFSLNRARTDQPRFLHRSLLTSADTIQAVDKTTVRITNKRPDVTVLPALGADGLAIMNPELVEKTEKFTTAEQVIGSGAFVMKDAKEKVGSEYARNPDYFNRELPYLDGVRTQFFSDAIAAFAAFQAGRVDILGRMPGTEVKNYIARQGPGYTAQWFDLDFVYWLMPQTEKRPFNDRRLTRALRLLADHDEFIKAHAEIQFGRGRHGSIFPSALGAWDVPQEEYTKRIFWQQPKEAAIKEALDLLKAAGFDRTNPLKFELATWSSDSIRAGAELLHAQFRQNGQGAVQAEIKVYDLITARRVIIQKAFEYGYWPNDGAMVEPGVWLNQLWRTGGSRNSWGISDPRLDSLIEKQNTTFNVQERKAVIKDIFFYMMDNSPAVASSALSSLSAVNPKIRGLAPEAFLNGRQYQWMWLAS